MALSWLFPKDSAQPTASTSTPAPSTPAPAGALPVDHTAPPRSIFDEVDGEQMPGRDKDGRRKLPPVALYVSGAAFALTIGLTALIVPYVRMAAQSAKAPAAAAAAAAGSAPGAGSNAALAATHSIVHPPGTAAVAGCVAAPQGILAKGLASPASASPASGTSSTAPPAVGETLRPTLETAQTQEALFGTPDDVEPPVDRDAVSPLLGFYALGIATAIVGASAGLGVWGTARMMGVDNMEDFARLTREGLAVKMPALAQAIDAAKEAEQKDLGENDGRSIWEQWTDMVLKEEKSGEKKI